MHSPTLATTTQRTQRLWVLCPVALPARTFCIYAVQCGGHQLLVPTLETWLDWLSWLTDSSWIIVHHMLLVAVCVFGDPDEQGLCLCPPHTQSTFTQLISCHCMQPLKEGLLIYQNGVTQNVTERTPNLEQKNPGSSLVCPLGSSFYLCFWKKKRQIALSYTSHS